jgi:hypothetical protein
MNSLSFVWAGPTALAAELSKPIKRISVEFVISNSGPRFVTLWRPDETGLRLFTEMHDVAERIEVGVLQFEQVFTLGPNEVITDLPSVFHGENVVSKLVIHESGTSAESGVVIKASNGDEIVAVAGVYPYSLAVLGALSIPHMFEPQYELDDYMRVPIT